MNKYYKEYEQLLKNKPHSKEIALAMKRMPYYEDNFSFNQTYVDKLINFIENFIYLQKGGDGTNFKLLTEQKFWVSLFGYENKKGVPVINELPILIGAGSGKTTLLAALSLALMIVGSAKGNDIMVFANTKEQAHELFTASSAMIKDEHSKLDKLRKAKMLRTNRNEILYEPTTSKLAIRSMDNDSVDGTNLRAAIFDEFHAYRIDAIQNVRKSSLPKRVNSTGFVSIYISTNGTTRDNVFDVYYDRFERILHGEQEDWTSFPLIYKLDDIEEVHNIDMYEKAAPFIKEISDPSILYQQLMSAKGNPAAQAEILAKSFNLPQQEYNAYFTADNIKKAYDLTLEPDDNEVYVGFDMASVNDLSSLAFVQKSGIGFTVKTHSFIPKDTFDNAPRDKKAIYTRFAENNELTIVDTPTIDQDFVFDYMVEYIYSNNLIPAGFASDAYYSRQLRNNIKREFGDEMMHTVRVNVMQTSEPAKNIKALVDAGRASINEELMAWALGNIRVKIDGAGNVYWNKAKAVDKIDPTWALLNAYWLIVNEDDKEWQGW